MATAPNKDVLAAAGLLAGDAEGAGANDLVVAIDAADDAADEALAAAEEALSARADGSPAPAAASRGACGRWPRSSPTAAASRSSRPPATTPRPRRSRRCGWG